MDGWLMGQEVGRWAAIIQDALFNEMLLLECFDAGSPLPLIHLNRVHDAVYFRAVCSCWSVSGFTIVNCSRSCCTKG